MSLLESGVSRYGHPLHREPGSTSSRCVLELRALREGSFPEGAHDATRCGERGVPIESMTEEALEPARRGSRWWLVVVAAAAIALTTFILVSAGETPIPFMYTTSGH